MKPVRLIGGLTCAALIAAAASFAQTQSMTTSRKKVTPDPKQENRLPRELRDLGWDQKIGGEIPRDLRFVSHDGVELSLGELLHGRPILLAPVYYECPMLCSLVLDGVVRALRPLSFLPGQDFDVVTVSFNPNETPELAAKSRNTVLSRYGRAEGQAGWSFLTGRQEEIAPLMKSIGFRYKFDESTGLYGHAGGVVLLTPEGKISRYFYGVDYAPKDLRLGLIEASENRLGTIIDQVVLFCYQYDPALGKYSATVLNVIRIAGIFTVLVLALFVIRSIRRERAVARLAETSAS